LKALQDLAAPEGVCFGCGPKNTMGLQIKSYWNDEHTHVLLHFHPGEHHVGWPTLVYGGLLSCLIDCHSNWTAMAFHYRSEGREAGTQPRIDCVTGSLNVKFIKPTPMGVPLLLKACVDGEVGRKTRVLCEVYADNILTVQGDSIFVRVDIGHLAKTAHARRL
jgi:hypothetical protein